MTEFIIFLTYVLQALGAIIVLVLFVAAAWIAYKD